MKTLLNIITISIFLLGNNLMAQGADQNPNFKESQTKYTEKKDELNKTQGETIQDTYVAYDWTENKQNKKNARIQRRHEIRMLRNQRNNVYYSSRCRNRRYNNYGYNNYNGYYNNGGNNVVNSVSNWGGALLTTAVLGTTLYHLFK